MKNFEVTSVEDGKKYWISRAIAVSCFIFKRGEDGQEYILANKRGKGTPDFQGKWNAICGYLDFDETIGEAAVREIKEETGLVVSERELKPLAIIDDPKENHQNIVFRFGAYLLEEETNCDLDESLRTGGEKDEVEEVKWIPVTDVDDYEWAFNHHAIIKELIGDGDEEDKTEI